MEEALPKFVEKVCPTHGRTEFVLEGRGYYRCKRCRMQRVMDWRRRAKALLIAEAGGCCRICGYDRCRGRGGNRYASGGRHPCGLTQIGSF